MIGVLTAERLRELLHYDPETGQFARRAARPGHRVGEIVGTVGKEGYRRIVIDNRRYLAHRLAWLSMTGEWPKHQIDHINMDRADNRWCNLREATRSQNNFNARARADNTSGFKGVVWNKQSRKWQARIKINGKNIHLGLFDTPHVAYAAYCLEAHKLHGEFARLYDYETIIEPGPQSIGNDFLGI